MVVDDCPASAFDTSISRMGSPASSIACSASAASPRPSSGDNGSEMSSQKIVDYSLLITAIVAAKSLITSLSEDIDLK